MLQGALDKKRVLDLFSGTGALGFEALSQGAAHVVFVEENRSQCKKIAQNLERLKIAGGAEVIDQEALRWLTRGANAAGPFNFIFLDPPYGSGLGMETLQAISKTGVLSKTGFVILECSKKEDMPSLLGQLHLVRQKRYGQTKVLIYAAKSKLPGGSSA